MRAVEALHGNDERAQKAQVRFAGNTMEEGAVHVQQAEQMFMCLQSGVHRSR